VLDQPLQSYICIVNITNSLTEYCNAANIRKNTYKPESGVLRSPPEFGFWPGVGVRVFPFEGDCDSRYILLDCTLSGFVAVYLSFPQFKFRLKCCLYTVVHLMLGECRFSLKSSLTTLSVCYILRLGVGVQVF